MAADGANDATTGARDTGNSGDTGNAAVGPPPPAERLVWMSGIITAVALVFTLFDLVNPNLSLALALITRNFDMLVPYTVVMRLLGLAAYPLALCGLVPSVLGLRAARRAGMVDWARSSAMAFLCCDCVVLLKGIVEVGFLVILSYACGQSGC